MDNILDQLSFNYDESFSVLIFLRNIVICAGLLYILSFLYIRYGKSISNRLQLSKVLIIVGITTFIIISIVKSSLALSLGLVGALSIVRFRTAIKEPEELGYFFISISLGLGLGANQLLPTIIGFAVLSLIIVLNFKSNLKNSFSQNLLISIKCNNKDKSKLTEQITSIVEGNSNQVDLKRIKYSEDIININFLLNVSSLNNLNSISNDLLHIDKNIDITFIDSEI